MTKNELLSVVVPATKEHWEKCHGRKYSAGHIYNALKGNHKAMLQSRYETLQKLGYIKEGI